MMGAVNSSEMSINIYQTTLCSIPDDSHLHTRHRKNLKCHQIQLLSSNAICMPVMLRIQSLHVIGLCTHVLNLRGVARHFLSAWTTVNSWERLHYEGTFILVSGTDRILIAPHI
jgi:hypothetical protein